MAVVPENSTNLVVRRTLPSPKITTRCENAKRTLGIDGQRIPRGDLYSHRLPKGFI
jgi:hypothetical protein